MKNISHTIFIFIFLSLVACNKSNIDDNEGGSDGDNGGNSQLGSGTPGVFGTQAVAAWDDVSAVEMGRIKAWNLLFLHQSVGQDLEEGCKGNGFPFDYYGPGDKTDKGLMGGIFVDVGGIANGDPYEKMRVFKEEVIRNKDIVKIGVFKFGYADIDDGNYLAVQTAYKAMIDEIRTKIPTIRFLHMTPPLVYSVESYDGNAARMKVGQWMISTFAARDVIFNLQALESNDGACQSNGIWRICPENRNSASDPSEVNGIDTSDGQGHLGKKAGQRISKALLMAIYSCGK
ncbi:MAG: hypothetical protein IPN29_14915 [Saprospiraceae bacterium]|nr:hypothetical protein [Saprospiraceae bacterium]